MKAPLLVQKLIEETLEYLDPYRTYDDFFKFYHDELQIKDFYLTVKNDLYIFGVGKSASFEVSALRALIAQSPLKTGELKCFALTKHNHTVKEDFKQWEGSHPLVSKENVENSMEFVEEIKKVQPEDTAIFLISGGTSALLEIPVKTMSFEQLKEEHRLLLSSGLNINEMNKKRKELSAVKGGGLLSYLKTENSLQLITCDIPNEDLADVGSGPLIGTHKKVHAVKTQSASLLLERLCKEGSRINDGIYDGHIDELLKNLKGKVFEKGKCYLSGGEATITIGDSDGLGGRNSHFVLAFAHEIYKEEKNRDIKICSVGTDGSDGPTDAAGAYIDYQLYASMDPVPFLKNFDSYHYFEKIGSLIKTGPTKTNVMDIRMIWRE